MKTYKTNNMLIVLELRKYDINPFSFDDSTGEWLYEQTDVLECVLDSFEKNIKLSY